LDQPPQFLPSFGDRAVKALGEALAINTPAQSPTIRAASIKTAVAVIASGYAASHYGFLHSQEIDRHHQALGIAGTAIKHPVVLKIARGGLMTLRHDRCCAHKRIERLRRRVPRCPKALIAVTNIAIYAISRLCI